MTQIAVNFNMLVQHMNRKSIHRAGSEGKVSYATIKQIEGALHHLEDNKTAEEVAMSEKGRNNAEATKKVRRQLSLAVSSEQLPWPSVRNRQDALPEPLSST